MKLSSDEARAIAFVLGLVALAGVARFVARPRGAPALQAGEAVDVRALESASEKALERERAAAKPLGADERVDVNGADAQQLDRLPGVGPALAGRIVAERERGGAFADAADLRAVSGLGPSLLGRLEPHLAFGPGRGLPARARSGPAAAGSGARAGFRPNPRGASGSGARGASGYVQARAAGEATGEGRGYTEASAAGLPRWSSEVRGRGPERAAGQDRVRRGQAGDVAPVRPGGPTVSARPRERLDVNRASAEELEALPGIGPALAARIVAKRDSLGGFGSVADLDRVRGIGPAMLMKLRPYFRE